MSFKAVLRQVNYTLGKQYIVRKYQNLSRNGINTSRILCKYLSEDFRWKSCWKCGADRQNCTELFCSKCNVIQKPSYMDNYFKVFNLSETFDIDSKTLREKYRRLQSNLHPDKFTNSTSEEKEISTDYSSLVNKAYNCLLVPLKRAEHLLKLLDNQIEERQVSLDTGFLMEMMELNEEAENTTDPEKLRQLDIKNKKEMGKLILSIDECFKEKNLHKAKLQVIKLQYYSSLGHRINATLRNLGVVD